MQLCVVFVATCTGFR